MAQVRAGRERPALTCAMAIVLVKQGRDIEASALGGRDQLKQRAQLLSVECVEPVKIVPANACQQPHASSAGVRD